MSKQSKQPMHFPFPGIPTMAAQATRWACWAMEQEYAHLRRSQAENEKRVALARKLQEVPA
jgi:hypothetical protein